MTAENAQGVYPYPQRPSELVSNPEFVSALKVEPILLSEEEKKELADFDESIYKKVKDAKKGKVGNHVIYPEAFATAEGQRIFAATYMDPSLWRQIEDIADVKKRDNRGDFAIYNAAYEDLQKIAESSERYDELIQGGTRFAKLEQVLAKRGDKRDVVLSVTAEISTPKNEHDVKSLFNSIDLRQIPERVRVLSNNYSSGFAREEFKRKYKEQNGVVSEADAPERIGKAVSPAVLRSKLRKLRATKKWIKELRSELREDKSNLGESKTLLCNLYLQNINLKIADQYSLARLIAEDTGTRTKSKREALGEVYGFSHQKETLGNIPRVMERIDHFAKGVGLKLGPDGLFNSIPERLSEHIEGRISGPKDSNPEYEKYNKHKLDAEQVKIICDFILASYGWNVGKKSWKVEIDKTRKTMSANSTKRIVRVPTSYSKGLVDVLSTASYEIEGHVARAKSSSKLKDNLKVVGEMVGRSSILSEAAAMGVEAKTKKEAVGVDRSPLPYHYLVLREKQRGGNFTSCFTAYFEAKLRKEYDTSPQDVISDDRLFKEVFKSKKNVFDTAYNATLRAFRNHTPLGDTSGYVPTSEQLKYAEQELVGEALLTDDARELGLDNLLFVKGIDLYSLYELQRLGALDLDQIEKPKMVAARELWPKIKKRLDNGEELDQVIESLATP